MRRFKQVDVFTDRPFGGNPVAVVIGAEDLDAAAMQRIANWTNLSETTFLLRPTCDDADYRVRIFTPRSELPFAGHPTLGTAHAALEAGLAKPRDGALVQECGAGLVPLRIRGDGAGRQIALQLPPARSQHLSDEEVAALETALVAPVLRDPRARLLDVGPRWIVAQLADAAAVHALSPDFAAVMRLDARLRSTGITVFGAHPAGGDAAYQVRSFAPSEGIAEDPVCGSGNGCVAAFLRDTAAPGATLTYTASQGEALGRSGRIHVEIDATGRILVGGQCVTCIEGEIRV